MDNHTINTWFDLMNAFLVKCECMCLRFSEEIDLCTVCFSSWPLNIANFGIAFFAEGSLKTTDRIEWNEVAGLLRLNYFALLYQRHDFFH